jgi:O-antigen ligase
MNEVVQNREMANPLAPAPPGADTRLLWLMVAVVGCAFFLIGHDLQASQRDEYYGMDREVLEAASSGNWENRIGFSLLALMGAGLLILGGSRPWHFEGLLPLLLVFFVAWCVASISWAIDPGRTVRRLGSLLFCFLGALGIARQLSGRDLCLFTLGLTAVYAILSLGMECLLGAFRPYAGDHRFAGTLHPNGQGLNCAFLCLAAALLLPGETRRRALLLGLFIAGAILLLLTRSRTSLAALLAALVVLRCLRPSPRSIALGLFLTWSVTASLLFASLIGVDIAEQFTGTLFMGRQEDPGTLSGRTELWEELASYSRRYPWIGCGYGGFWTAQHIDEVSSTLYWGISSAHSSYVEAILTIGLIGTGALLLVVVAGLWRGGRDYFATADPGSGLLVGFLVYGLIQGFLESDLGLPTFLTFLTACGLSRLAFFRNQFGLDSRASREQESP